MSTQLQYDRKGVPDIWDVYGTVVCKAEIESTSPEVTLTLGHADSASWTPLENLLHHPCVQNYQTQGIYISYLFFFLADLKEISLWDWY